MAEPRQRYKDSADMSKAATTELPVESLGAWLERAIPDFRGLHTARKFAGGQSNPTFLLEADSGRYVLRRKPPGALLASAHAVDREYRVLRALAAHRCAGAARARAVRRRHRDRQHVLRDGVPRRAHPVGAHAAGTRRRASRAHLRRDEPRAGGAAPRRYRRGGPGRLRPAGQLLRAAAQPLDEAVSCRRDRAHRGHGSADRVARRAHAGRTTGAWRWCTATTASTT